MPNHSRNLAYHRVEVKLFGSHDAHLCLESPLTVKILWGTIVHQPGHWSLWGAQVVLPDQEGRGENMTTWQER